MESSKIKVLNCSRLFICDICEEWHSSLKDSVFKGFNISELLWRKDPHLNRINEERMAYIIKRNWLHLDLESSCSTTADGDDQSAFDLPHLTTYNISRQGHSLKLKLIGVLDHAVQNNFFLLLMTQEQKTGAKQIVEDIHRFINEGVSMINVLQNASCNYTIER